MADPQAQAPVDPEDPDASPSDLTDAAEDAPEAPDPSIPKPPAGILPVAEVTRLSYAPRERPRVRFIGDTLVVVTQSGTVEGHDAATGEFRFKLGLPGESLFPPIEVEGEIVVSSASGKLLRIDPERGALLAELALPFSLALPPLAVPESRSLYVATPEGDVAGFAIDDLEGEPRFRVRTAERVTALAAMNGVLVVSGAERTLSAIDARSGTALWHFVGRGGFSPVAFRRDGKRVFAGDDLGEFYSLNLDNGKVDFHWSTGASIRAAPLVEGKVVFVVSLGNNVYAYDAGGGGERWRAPLPGRPALGATRIHTQLIVPTLDGILMEVDIQTGRLGKSHGLGGELASAPAFHVVSAPEGYFEMLEEMRKAAAEKAAAAQAARTNRSSLTPTDDAQETETTAAEAEAATEADATAQTGQLSPPEAPPGEEPGTPTFGSAPEPELEAEAESKPDVPAAPSTPPGPPEWFEQSRIAVALRTGEVVLLGHQVAPPAATPAPGTPPPTGVPTEDTTVQNRRPPGP